MKTKSLFPCCSFFTLTLALALLALPTISQAQSNADLSDLAPSAGTLTPTFASGTFSYTASVPYATNSITVTPTAVDNTATITVDGNPVASGNPSSAISLSVGPNVITTVVISQDTTVTNTYTLTVTRAAGNSADLTSLVSSTGPLTPAFASGTYSYTASVPYATNSLTVTPTAADALAAITVNGNTVASGSPFGPISLSVGANIITNVVISQDATVTNTYTITVTRAAGNNANLANLVSSTGPLTPTFASGTYSYTASVPYATNSLTVTPTAADALAAIKVNGNAVASGNPSSAISLSVGANVITTVVISQDTTVTNTYTLTVTRAIGSTWANSNVTGTPVSSLNWSNAVQGAWTDGTPVSTNAGTIQFFSDTTTALSNTVPATQTSVVDYGGLFQLGTLTLSGKASGTASANLTNTISGDPLNFSAATGTINLNGLNNTRTLTYNLNSAIQLGTASSATALTITGNGTGAFNIGGIISELQSGGGSLIKSGSSTVSLTANNSYSGGTTISAGTVVATTGSAFGTSNITVSGSSTVNISTNLTFSNNIAVNAALSMKILMAATANTNTFSGVLSGSSAISIVNNGNNGVIGQYAFNNTSNTFTGNVVFVTGSSAGDDRFQFNSIGDGGNFTLQKSGHQNSVIYNGSSNIVFNTRAINVGAISGTFDGGGTTPVNAFANNGAGIVVFNSAMTVGAVNAAGGTLFFTGSNTGTNTFAGVITNGTGGAFGIGKTGAGKWVLTRLNSYAGETLVRNGTLSVNVIDVAANNQPIGKNAVMQLGHLADTGTLEFTGGANSTTDKQVRMGNPNSNSGNNGGGIILNNGSGSLTFSAPTFNPTVATVTATRTLTLGGTYSSSSGANEIQGTIQNNTNTGPVALTVSGSTWKLSGANTYRGVTTVSGGTLLINGDSSAVTNRVTVVSGGTFGGLGTMGGTVTNRIGSTLAPGANGVAGTLTLTNGLGLNGAYLSFILTNANAGEYSQVAITNGSFVANGLNLIQLTAATNQIPTGTYTLITNVNARTGAGNFVFHQTGTTNWTIGSATLTLTTNANSVVLAVSGGPVAPVSTAFNWQGGVNGTWDTATLNWQSNGVALLYADGKNVFFNDAATTFTVTNGAGFSPNPGSVTFNNSISNYTVSVAIQGAGNLTNAGSGTTILSGTNSYAGTTYVNSGVLRVANPTALGGTAGGTIVSSGAELSCNTTLTNSGEALTLSGSGTGSGAAHVGGSKIWTWDGPVTLAANSQVNADGGSTLVLTNNSITGANTTLTLAGSGVCYLASALSLGTGAVKITGAGSPTLANGGNSFSGGLIHQGSGTVTVSAAGAQGSGDISFDGASASGTVTFAGFSGSIANNIIATNGGTGGVAKSGAGTTNILTGNNTYIGATTISPSGGTLVAIAPSAFGSSSNIIVNATAVLSLRGDSSTTFVKASDSTPYTVSYNTGNNATIDVDQATPAGTSAKTMTIGALKASTTSAAVTVVFTGANNTSLSVGNVTGPAKQSATMSVTYSNMIASPGTLTLASFTSTSGGTTSSDTVLFDGTGNTTVTGGVTNTSFISLPLALIKNGAGTLTLAGANAYTGATAVNAGKLLVNGNSSAATGAVTVATNATFGGTGTVGGVVNYQDGSLATFTVTPEASDTYSNSTYMTFASAAFLTNVTVKVDMPVGLGNGTYVLATNYVGFTTSGTLTFATNSGSLVSGSAGTVSVAGNNLILTVAPVGGPSTPGNFSSISVTGTTLNLTVTNGTPNGAWTLLESTNLLVPIAQWPTNRTGNYDGSGNLTTNIVDTATNPAAFFLLK